MVEVTSEQKEASYKWVLEFHKEADKLDPDLYVKKCFAPDAILNFGTNQQRVGHEEILEDFQSMHNLESMKHTLIKETLVVVEDRILQESLIEYVVKNDPEKKVIPVRGFGVHWKAPNETTMRRFDVIGDFSKLGERVKWVNGLTAQ